MGVQAKYYQIKSDKIIESLRQIKAEENYYTIIWDSEMICSNLDIDKSYFELSELVASLSKNQKLSKLAFYGVEIDTQYNYPCDVRYIPQNKVCEIAAILREIRIENEEEFSNKYNDIQDVPYDKVVYDNIFKYYWCHYNSIVEFYKKCCEEKSAIFLMID